MELKEHIKFKFDIDRIIDDWILMGFLADKMSWPIRFEGFNQIV